ncbi:hypothetical protein HY639_02085 [Candidatus Woesearchaeota archaeon]|nr:hypothetical protein [Candidatus Woesearchaeota archaeon]
MRSNDEWSVLKEKHQKVKRDAQALSRTPLETLVKDVHNDYRDDGQLFVELVNGFTLCYATHAPDRVSCAVLPWGSVIHYHWMTITDHSHPFLDSDNIHDATLRTKRRKNEYHYLDNRPTTSWQIKQKYQNQWKEFHSKILAPLDIKENYSRDWLGAAYFAGVTGVGISSLPITLPLALGMYAVDKCLGTNNQWAYQLGYASLFFSGIGPWTMAHLIMKPQRYYRMQGRDELKNENADKRVALLFTRDDHPLFGLRVPGPHAFAEVGILFPSGLFLREESATDAKQIIYPGWPPEQDETFLARGFREAKYFLDADEALTNRIYDSFAAYKKEMDDGEYNWEVTTEWVTMIDHIPFLKAQGFI